MRSPAPPSLTCALVARARAGCARSRLFRADSRQWPDYGDPAKFATNLVRCMDIDSGLSGEDLLRAGFNVMVVAGVVAKAAGLVNVSEAAERFSSALEEYITSKKAEGLQIVMDAYSKLAQLRKPGQPFPVIIIDAANVLAKWGDTAWLKALLRFFVRITKQEGLAHVVLATSDTFLTQWLERGAPIG